ncbi:MAG: hypothetical protein H6874_08005 [Hyphomicrobiaceae bacterium]|nr:hypothetical protein [Hyphomicrobiaceae bacterium]
MLTLLALTQSAFLLQVFRRVDLDAAEKPLCPLFQTLDDLDLTGKRVLVRVGINVLWPMAR